MNVCFTEPERVASHLKEKLRGVVPDWEIDAHAPLIARINQLKRERNAVILGHNYQVPEIFHGISDFTGDSLALANRAAETDADVIVFCGVHFMAETAKILNPEKTVLLPDMRAGCSLAESISPEDVRALKARYPGVPVVTYINVGAAIKAESDYCCTSANALEVIEAASGDRVIFIPDEYLALNIARQTRKEIITWSGKCMVHEQFDAEMLRSYRRQFPDIYILAHPECEPEVVDEADFTGSTSAMIRQVGQVDAPKVMLVTECNMSANIQNAYPEKDFQTPCTMCPHMGRITLERVEQALLKNQYVIELDPDIAARAKRSLDRMLAIGRGREAGMKVA